MRCVFLKKDEALSKRRDKNENAQEQGVSQGETFLNAADEFLEFVTRLDRIIIINWLEKSKNENKRCKHKNYHELTLLFLFLCQFFRVPKSM